MNVQPMSTWCARCRAATVIAGVCVCCEQRALARLAWTEAEVRPRVNRYKRRRPFRAAGDWAWRHLEYLFGAVAALIVLGAAYVAAWARQ